MYVCVVFVVCSEGRKARIRGGKGVKRRREREETFVMA